MHRTLAVEKGVFYSVDNRDIVDWMTTKRARNSLQRACRKSINSMQNTVNRSKKYSVRRIKPLTSTASDRTLFSVSNSNSNRGTYRRSCRVNTASKRYAPGIRVGSHNVTCHPDASSQREREGEI